MKQHAKTAQIMSTATALIIQLIALIILTCKQAHKAGGLFGYAEKQIRKVFFLLTFSFSKEKVVYAGAGKWNDRRHGGYLVTLWLAQRSFVLGFTHIHLQG
jgi:hypothetical protein